MKSRRKVFEKFCNIFCKLQKNLEHMNYVFRHHTLIEINQGKIFFTQNKEKRSYFYCLK